MTFDELPTINFSNATIIEHWNDGERQNTGYVISGTKIGVSSFCFVWKTISGFRTTIFHSSCWNVNKENMNVRFERTAADRNGCDLPIESVNLYTIKLEGSTSV